jgi:SSS family solute:Na+ symporter
MIANMLVRSSFPVWMQSPINAGAFCMIAGLIIVPLVSLLTPKPDEKIVEDAFACYDTKVLVHQKEALADED